MLFSERQKEVDPDVRPDGEELGGGRPYGEELGGAEGRDSQPEERQGSPSSSERKVTSRLTTGRQQVKVLRKKIPCSKTQCYSRVSNCVFHKTLKTNPTNPSPSQGLSCPLFILKANSFPMDVGSCHVPIFSCLSVSSWSQGGSWN